MKNAMNRRGFLQRSFWLMGIVGLVTVGLIPSTLFAQAQVRWTDRYDHLPIVQRKPFQWPGGKTLAVWIINNVEVWHYDSPVGTATSPNFRNIAPDVINYAWREYGMRVGIWRIMEVLDAAKVRSTVALNSAVCQVFPKVIEEMKKRGWEFMGHGITNSEDLARLSLEKEKEVIQTTLKTIEECTGKRPTGWLGPGLVETINTLDILGEEGVQYVGDWNNDDLPYPMKVKKGKLYSIPYSLEINDLPLFLRKNYSGQQYLQAVKDQFDTLYSDSKKLSRVMAIPIHPFLVGQPLNIRYFQRAIAHIKKHEGVWFATGSEIIEAYQSRHPEPR